MYPAPFEYLVPRNLDEAAEMLNRYGEEAKVLAGGQSLVPLMKLRLVRPKYVVDINRITHLSSIRERNGSIICNSMTRHVQIEESSLLRERLPLLCEAASYIGDTQVRNRGTIGGALVEADPAGDWGPVALALNARLKCFGPQGERTMEAKDFFTFAYTTALANNEILTEVIFPTARDNRAGAYFKLEKTSGDFAIVSVAVQLTLGDDEICQKVGIGLGGAGPTPSKAWTAEQLLTGKKASDALIEKAAELIVNGANPLDDLRGSGDYKREVLKVCFKRAIARAITRSKEKVTNVT